MDTQIEAKARKRHKEVFPIDEIPHLWMHKVQPSARNSQGNLYFKDEVIYSYGSHFPIAAHVSNKRKESAVLFNDQTYSKTTARQQYAVKRAIPPSVTVFTVSDLFVSAKDKIGHSQNIQNYQGKIDMYVNAASRARQKKLDALEQANAIRSEALAYAKFFSLRVKIGKIPMPNSKELAKIAESNREAAKVQAEKNRIAREAAIANERERLEKWSNGENVYSGFRNSPVALRVLTQTDTETGQPDYIVETSLGARVPLSHAKRALKFVRAVVAKGEPWQANGHTFHIGHYALDRADADGTIKAGCHTITKDAWERIAPQLESINVPMPEETQEQA